MLFNYMNSILDPTAIQKFVGNCASLTFLNLEQNPVVHDKLSINSKLLCMPSTTIQPIQLLPNWNETPSTQTIEIYLEFLSSITSMCIELRQTIEKYQYEPRDLLTSIHERCNQYKSTEPIISSETVSISKPVSPSESVSSSELVSTSKPMTTSEPEFRIQQQVSATKTVDDTVIISNQNNYEQSIIRLQSFWRRRLIQQLLEIYHTAAQIIQARWRGYIVRKRMQEVRQLFKHQKNTTYDEIDLTEFDFDEVIS